MPDAGQHDACIVDPELEREDIRRELRPAYRPVASTEQHPMYDQKTLAGGVQARTVACGTVQHPVVVTLDGIATELTLADAMKLRDGLTAAVGRVEAAEKAALARDHHFTIGRTIYGLSSVPSKLPAGCHQELGHD